MKASITFRDERKPLLRAKIPINILGFPFQSAVAAGESKDLALSLSTFSDWGPSLKFSYRPNDSEKPFAVVFKTGVGNFGSPSESPLIMSAELNLIGAQNPSFLIQFKPNLGDFCVKKLSGAKEDEGHNGCLDASKGVLRASVDGLMRGVEIGAKTSVPVRDLATVNFRWGIRVPAEETVVVGSKDGGNSTAGLFGKNYRHRLPYLVMSKIGIKQIVAKKEVKRDEPSKGKNLGELTEAYVDIEKHMDSIRSENMALGKALNDLRLDLAANKKKVEPSLDKKGTNGDNNSKDVPGLKDGTKL